MIFAAEEVTQGLGVTACILAVVSMVVTYFDNRDKRRYDARIVKLEADMDACGRKHAEDEQTIKELREKDAQQQKEIDSLKRQLLESDTNGRRMQGEIVKLKKEMTESGRRADSTVRKVPDSDPGPA